jgi:hypothetical protein
MLSLRRLLLLTRDLKKSRLLFELIHELISKDEIHLVCQRID